MVGIDFGYCNPTCFQTRGPKVEKWACLFVQLCMYVASWLFFWFWGAMKIFTVTKEGLKGSQIPMG